MQTGWLQDGGTWYYLNGSGAMKASQWFQVGGTWYYLDNSGAMKTGWLKQGGSWYYLDDSGAMKTGWFQVDGNGTMLIVQELLLSALQSMVTQ